MEITDKISYALGFLWADGYITKGSNNIGLFLKSDDFNEIKNIIKELIPYQKTTIRYTESNKHKEQTGFNFSDKKIANFLTENDYRYKSKVSADKVISLILKNNVAYFLRGFFDGDGTVCNKKGSHSISFTGSINQSWKWMITIFEELDIKYNLYKYESNKGSFSRITIYNIKNCVKLFDFIYPNKKYNFGLKRKYDSLNEIFFKLDDDYIYKSRRNGMTEIEYYFINNRTNEEFTVVGEKKVYEFFKCKNIGLKHKERYCGQKIIDKENTTQKDITFLKKKRIKKNI